MRRFVIDAALKPEPTKGRWVYPTLVFDKGRVGETLTVNACGLENLGGIEPFNELACLLAAAPELLAVAKSAAGVRIRPDRLRAKAQQALRKVDRWRG